jgi:hypothetical protein
MNGESFYSKMLALISYNVLHIRRLPQRSEGKGAEGQATKGSAAYMLCCAP